MHLYNFPVYKPVEFYNRVINKITAHLSGQKGILSVYQIGGINDPGISDIDIVAVFEDNVKNYSSSLSSLNEDEKYLFTHSIFGISRSFLTDNFRYSLFNNFKILWGEEIIEKKKESSCEILKTQTALEYLLSNVIARTVEKHYRLLSIRNILLSAKAIDYDLLLLNCPVTEPIKKDINEVINLRREWFNESEKKEKSLNWYNSFYKNIFLYVTKILKEYPVYLPENKNYKISRNIKIISGNRFEITINGFTFPPWVLFLNRKIRNANSLFNTFNFRIPVNTDRDIFLDERFRFYSNMLKYNREYLPCYNPLSNSILTKTSL